MALSVSDFKDVFLSASDSQAIVNKLDDFFEHQVEKFAFQNPDGLVLTGVRLKKQSAEPTLVIIPGRGEIAHKFAELLYCLDKLNLDIAILFCRGQGESTRLLPDPQKCHIEDFNKFRDDLQFMLGKLEIKNYNLMAFSLGCLLSLDLIKYGSNLPLKASLIAPFIWPYFKAPRIVLEGALRLLGWLSFTRLNYTPHGSEYKRLAFEANHHSHCNERFNRYHDYYVAHPELTIGGPTYSFLRQTTLKQTEFLRQPFDFKLPVKAYLAGLDKVVDSQVSGEFFQSHSHDTVPPQYELIDGMFHDVINESDEFRTPVLTGALSFLYG